MSENKYIGRRVRSSSLTTIISISLVLFMLGLLGLIILNTQKISDHVKENINFELILKDDLKDAETERLLKTLDASAYVKTTEFITKEQAAKDLQEDIGEDFISFLGTNPLSASIKLHFNANYTNEDSLIWIEKELSQYQPVKEVLYQKSLVGMVNENARIISLGIMGLCTLLMIIALALINNTIRLSIYSKRFMIKTMQLVGATGGFISKPFLLNGVKHGIYSAFIAIALLISFMYLIEQKLPELKALQDVQILAQLFSIVIALGILISLISTWLSVRKFLRMDAGELYY